MTTLLEDDVNHLESAEHDRTKGIAGQDNDDERVTTFVTAAIVRRGIISCIHQAQFRDKRLVRFARHDVINVRFLTKIRDNDNTRHCAWQGQQPNTLSSSTLTLGLLGFTLLCVHEPIPRIDSIDYT